MCRCWLHVPHLQRTRISAPSALSAARFAFPQCNLQTPLAPSEAAMRTHIHKYTTPLNPGKRNDWPQGRLHAGIRKLSHGSSAVTTQVEWPISGIILLLGTESPPTASLPTKPGAGAAAQNLCMTAWHSVMEMPCMGLSVKRCCPNAPTSADRLLRKPRQHEHRALPHRPGHTPRVRRG